MEDLDKNGRKPSWTGARQRSLIYDTKNMILKEKNDKLNFCCAEDTPKKMKIQVRDLGINICKLHVQ